MVTHSGIRSALCTLLVFGFLLAAQGLPAAEAHAELLSAYPAPGATLAAPPPEIRLTFSERVGPGSSIQLFGPQFRAVPGVRSGLDPAYPEQLRAFTPPLAPDTYTVEWRAISLDGHEVSGSYAFAIRALTKPQLPAGWPLLAVPLALLALGAVAWAIARRRRARTGATTSTDSSGQRNPVMMVIVSRQLRLLRRLASLFLALALSACSVDVSGVTPAATSGLPANPILVAPTQTLGPTPTLSAPNTTYVPVTPANGTPGVAATLASSPSHPPPTPFGKPVTWADRHLTGRLIFTAGTEGVLQLDLTTGTVTSLFAPPDSINSWVVAAAALSAPPQQVIAYAPPPVSGSIQFGYTTLYHLPTDGSSPQPLFAQVNPKESYFDPTWSPDGHWLYYVHLTTPVTQTDTSHFAIERLAFPGDQSSTVVTDAFWPRVSPDGQRLAFVHYDYQTGLQTLFVANLDGSQQRQIQLPAFFQSTDSPMFTPDNQALMFSGITDGSIPALSWLDRLLGVRTAYADGNPADWWSVPVAGGPPKQLTHINDSSMYGSFSPDGQHVAYISASGLFVMKPDGTDIVPLMSITDLPGSVGTATVDWLP